MWDETRTKKKVSNWHLNACPWKAWLLFHFWRHHLLPKLNHLYSSSAGGNDLSNDTHGLMRVIGSIKPEICTKMVRNWSENSKQNFPRLHLDFPSCCFFENSWAGSEPRRSTTVQQKDKNRMKASGEKKKRRRSFPRPKPFEILITAPSQKEIS